MFEGLQALTEKEKQTLRLVVRGHDAKSMARHLGLSVHTINERLRDSRRKLAVSSSREAARLLFEAEGKDPDKLADKQIGDAGDQANPQHRPAPQDGPEARSRGVRATIGAIVAMLILGILALAALPQQTSVPNGTATPAVAEASPPEARSEIVKAALAWLALVDQGRWDESWAGTSASFRKANTAKAWAAESDKMRLRLGAVLSRKVIDQGRVPTPPYGYEMVKFETSFAKKPSATETVTLAREDGQWKVVGIWID